MLILTVLEDRLINKYYTCQDIKLFFILKRQGIY